MSQMIKTSYGYMTKLEASIIGAIDCDASQERAKTNNEVKYK